MCGIVGGICKNNITSILVDGLKRLEYRGYDSAGVVVLSADNELQRARAVGKLLILKTASMLKNFHWTAQLALPIPAGPPMESHQAEMPIHIFATIRLAWCIMASLKIILSSNTSNY